MVAYCEEDELIEVISADFGRETTIFCQVLPILSLNCSLNIKSYIDGL